MLRFVASFLVRSLTPASAIRLGELLIELGQTAQARLARVDTAVKALRNAVASLTEK